MTWQVLQMPEDTEQLADWLDRQLVGLHLREFANELVAVHRESAGRPSANELLGEQRNKFLAQGFRALDDATISEILTHASVLLELQAMVFESGSSYWYTLQHHDAKLQTQLQQNRRRIEDTLHFESPHSVASVSVGKSRLATLYARPALASLATAATLFVAFFAFEFSRSIAPSAVAWGWAKPDALPRDGSAKQYFTSLADSGEAWFDKRPEDAISLARRITEFRQGCAIVLLSEQKPLNDEQKLWLRSKCRAWADKLDKQLAALEAGQSSSAIQVQVDETVNSLIHALRERARSA